MSGMNPTFTRLELRRVLRDYANMFFIVGLPAFMYLIFGASQEYADEPLANGDVALYIMAGMAAYGAVTATTGIGGMAAVERMQGWGRQLGLTPLSDAGYVAMKSFVALVVASLPVLLIFALGWFTGASGPLSTWLLSGAVVLVGAVTFALFGLAVGLAFRSEASVSVAGGTLVVMAFLGNLFFPLSGAMLALAKFTPLYGYATLARYPITGGEVMTADGFQSEPLWVPTLNVAVWTVIFALVAIALVRRGRSRQ
jgi:ABC-2 type transport system permease protein